MVWAPELLDLSNHSVFGTKPDGEIVDKLSQEERVVILHQPAASRQDQYGIEHSSMTELMGGPTSSMRCSGDVTTPGWWFHHFEPVWSPFIQRLCRQKKVTLGEFERAASQVTGLTPIEKAIAMLAFRQQHEQRSAPPYTTAFRTDHSPSDV
jgi:hypothetical protein